MADRFYTSPFDDNPIVSGGLKRRAAADADYYDAREVEEIDPNKGNWGAETTRSIASSTANDLTSGLEYLGRGLVGDTEGRQRAAEEYLVGQEEARAMGPEIQTMDDAAAAGGGVGDYLKYGAYEFAKMVPDIAMTATGIGAGGVAARAGAKTLLRRSVAKDLREFATQRGVFEAAEETATKKVMQSGLRAMDAPNAIKLARAEARDGIEDTIARQAAIASGRTPRDIAARAAAGRVGGLVGGTAASIPTLNGSENAELAADADTTTGDMWALAAGTTAAAATQVLPLERLMGRFGSAARAEVAKKAERFLPRAAREGLTQGAFEGSQEVLQQALQNASQAYVTEDPTRLWGPDAAKEYLASFIVGGAMGGTLGVAGEGVRSLGGGVANASRTSRDYIKGKMQEYGDAAREKRDRRRAGEPMPGSEKESAPGSVSNIRDVLRRAGSVVNGAAENIVGMGKTAAGKVRGAWHDLDVEQDSEDLYRDIEDRHTRFEQTGAPEGPELQRLTSPVQMGNKFQDILMRTVSLDSPIWASERAAKDVGATLERVARGADLTKKDNAILQALSESSVSGVDKNTLNLIRTAGPEAARAFDGLQKKVEEAGPDAGDAPIDDGATLNTQMADALRGALPSRDAAPIDDSGDATIAPNKLETHQGGDADPIDVMEGLRASKRPEDIERHNAIKADLREQVLGSRSTAWSRMKGYEADFDAKLASAGGVETAALRPSVDKSGKPVIARSNGGHTFINADGEKAKAGEQAYERQVIDLAGIANRQIQRMGKEQYGDDEGNISGAEAMLKGLAELKTLGIDLKPETFTTGRVEMSNGKFIAEIVDGPTNLKKNRINIDDLRGTAPVGSRVRESSKVAADQDNAHVIRKLGKSIRNRFSERKAAGTLPKDSLNERGMPVDERGYEQELSPQDEEFARAQHREAKRDERKDLEEDFDQDKDKLIPRARPDGILIPGNKTEAGAFVSSMDPVTDVRVDSAYADIVLAAKDMGPEAKFAAGVMIGKAELAKEVAAGMSAPRHAKLLRALENPDSGVAARYWNRAYNKGNKRAPIGETASVSHRGAAKDTRRGTDKPGMSRGLPESRVPRPAPELNKGTARENPKPAPAQVKPKSNKIVRKAAKPAQFDDLGPLADTGPGEHDFNRESKLATALMKALGFDRKITVSEHTESARAGGYTVTGALRLGDALTGAERIEVMSHEIGHAVIAEHMAKLLGVKAEDIRGADGTVLATADAWTDRLKEVDPKLYAALDADYQKWLEGISPVAGANEVRATRSPLHRGKGFLSLGPGKPFVKMKAADQAYLLSMNEWLADNIARALTQDTRAQGIVGKFFADIADVLRAAYKALFGTPEAAKYAPAPSVEAWVKQMFDANVAVVKGVTKKTVPRKVAKKIVRAAAAASAPAGATRSAQNYKDMAAYMITALRPEERLMLERVFNRPTTKPLIREHLGAAFPGVENVVDDSKSGMEMLLAAGYFAWKDGAFNGTGPKARSALIGIGDQMVSIFGASGDGDLAVRTLEEIANGTVEHLRLRNKKYNVRQLEAKANGTPQRVFNWLAQAGPISDGLAKFWSSTAQRLHDTGVPEMRALIAMLQRQQGATGEGDRGLIPAIRTNTLQWHNRYSDIVKDLNDTERKRLLQVLQRGAKAGDAFYDTRSQKTRTAVDAMRTMFQAFHAYDDASIGANATNRPKFRKNYFPVVMDVNFEGGADRLTALYSQPHFKDALFAKFNIPPNKQTDATFNRLVARAVAAAAEPATFDPSATLDEKASIGAASESARFSSFVYDASVYEYDPKQKKNIKVKPDTRTPAQKRADIKAFESLQSKNVDEIFARYFNPRVKLAEFQRRFGAEEVHQDAQGSEYTIWNRRGKLDDMVVTMKKQGAKPEDIRLAENAVKAALGVYGQDVSPTLNAISPALAKKFSGPKTKAFIQGGQAYQNLRLLPLALLSSLVDPMGIAVRTGGEMGSTWDGVKAGMRTIFNKKEAKRMHDELMELGLADDFMPAIASHPMFDQKDNSFARKVSESVFKWNGMNAWVQATRVMATHTAHKFLLKHGADTSEQSRRYLAELSLSPGDIVDDGRGRVVINEKTKAAIQQFVDESILRPNALQAPLWHRDPYMGLVTQYKSFAYAIFDQITKRVGREINHGNYRVLLAAMAYLPVALMAELLREFIQYGTDGNPRRAEWDAVDYTGYAAMRTGLVGPRADIIGDVKGDVERNDLPGTSMLGPAGGQAENVLDAFSGRRDLGKEFESALPASAGWRHWNDDTTVEAAA